MKKFLDYNWHCLKERKRKNLNCVWKLIKLFYASVFHHKKTFQRISFHFFNFCLFYSQISFVGKCELCWRKEEKFGENNNKVRINCLENKKKVKLQSTISFFFVQDFFLFNLITIFFALSLLILINIMVISILLNNKEIKIVERNKKKTLRWISFSI